VVYLAKETSFLIDDWTLQTPDSYLERGCHHSSGSLMTDSKSIHHKVDKTDSGEGLRSVSFQGEADLYYFQY
jgi:hypothetical protein